VIELTPDERDLLERIDDKEELRPFFFRKAKGLKWFDALAGRGYFKPEQNPRPLPSKEEGYVNIPFWPATEYLVATSSELLSERNKVYAEKFLEVIRTVTKHAIDQGFSNYRTWWHFSKVVQNIPPILIQDEDIVLFDCWLNDQYERDLVAEEIGEKWLTALLESDDQHCKKLAGKLLDIIYRLEFRKLERELGTRKEVLLRFRSWAAKNISKKVASKAGRVLGMNAVRIFQGRLESILVEMENDKWSSVWRSAIGDHAQNHGVDDAEDIILEAYRDSLLAYIEAAPEASREYVELLLISPYETVRRIAVYMIDQRFIYLSSLVDRVVTGQYFTSNFRHELWNLLNNHYKEFGTEQKCRVLEIIDGLTETAETEQLSTGATAYRRAIWLSAIKDYGDDVTQLYRECIGIIGGEPENPDFSSYMSGGLVDHKSPFSKEELLSLDATDLVKQLGRYLETYKPPRGFDEPGLEGLIKVLRQVVKAEPLRFYNQLDKFSTSDLSFVYALIEAYRELWSENTQLPWDEIWGSLLEFCRDIVTQDRFWSLENAKSRSSFVANRHWIVSEIGSLIEVGTKSDEHAFSEKLLNQAEEVILILIEKEKGEEFKIDSDAVTVAINSPRGRCVEALINLTLRSCRLADKQHDNHIETWVHFQPIYEAELARAAIGEYAFVTLVVNYLPNFLYMSKDWVLANLENIFDQGNYQKWLCALHGYAYVGTVYEGIYNHLKKNGHLVRALDDGNVKERVSEKIVQNIAVAYLNDFENIKDKSSLIHQLLVRKKYAELSQLIWFLWTLRKDDDEKLRVKVLELWPRILEVIDTGAREGRRLASKLCDWAVFVDVVDEKNKGLILAVAPFAEEDYNSYDLLKSIARISEQQPTEAYEIWLRLLDGARPDFPEEAIRAALNNLVRLGPEGVRKARNIVSEYLKGGNEQPSQWLREMPVQNV
jgi:hypothetical protein